VRVRPDLGANATVVSLEKERGAGRAARLLRYERALARAGEGSRPTLLAHMCPSYLVAAGPIVRARRMRSILWFAHPSVTRSLVAAEAIADVVLTSLPGAYPRRTAKVRAIGQAVDVDRLSFDERMPTPGRLRLLALGRTSPSKGFDRIVRAVAKARADGVDATLRIVGPSTTAAEREHRAELRRTVRDAGLDDAVSIEPALKPDLVPDLIRDCDALVNAMVAGSGDKVVFETMALGRPALVANPAFAPLLGGLSFDLSFDRSDEGDLAAAIGRLSDAPADVLTATLRELRARIERDHALEGWAGRVMALAGAAA
jgi:glycosyltransferase involved in cell wall biosynthesis